MLIDSSEFQNNVEKYIELSNEQEIVILQNGRSVARLVGMDKAVSFLTDKLLGVLSENINLDTAKSERLSRQ